MNGIKHRKLHFKSPLANPPWKDVYRKKCFERLRERRAKLIEQFRFPDAPVSCSKADSPLKVVNDVMEIEWNAIHQTKSFPSLSVPSIPYSSSYDSEEEVMREILLEIQDELQNEGELLLNEINQFQSRELQSRVEMLQKEEVICPVCKVRKLEEVKVSRCPDDIFQTPPKSQKASKTVLRCSCGLTLSGPDISFNRVQSALRTTINDHEKSCSSDLSFSSTEDSVAGTNILVTCQSCDWMTFLI